MAVTGEIDGGPALVGAPVVDTIGGLLAAQGILTALIARGRTGRGTARGRLAARRRAALASGAAVGLPRDGRADRPLRERASESRAVPGLPRARRLDLRRGVEGRTRGGRSARPPGGPSWPTTRASPRARTASRTGRSWTALLEVAIAERTVEEWMAVLEPIDVLCAPVNDYAQLVRHPAVLATGMIVEQEHPRAGRFTTMATRRQAREDAGHDTHRGARPGRALARNPGRSGPDGGGAGRAGRRAASSDT